MGNLYLKTDASTWTPTQGIRVKTSSAGYSRARKVWVKTSSAGWSQAWVGQIAETFGYSGGQTYYGTAKDGAGFYGRTRRNNTKGNDTLVVGDKLSSYANQRGWWRPSYGSVTGKTIEDALYGKSIISLKLNIHLSHTYWGEYNGDGTTTYAKVWGVPTFTSIVSDFNPSAASYIGTVAFYGDAADAAAGYLVVGESYFGTNPPSSGDRYPVYASGLDLTNQIPSSTKSALTSGKIKSFVMMAYDGTADRTGYSDYNFYSVEPGKTYNSYSAPADNLTMEITYE